MVCNQYSRCFGSHCVLLPDSKVGQLQPPQFLACPTVPPVLAPRTYERSGHQYARFTRMRVFYNSLYTGESSKEVGQ